MSKRNQLNILVVLLAFMLVATNASAVIALDRGVTTQIIYVDAQAAGVGNGQSWTDAYNDLQSALTEARTLAPAENVQIWVANGIYKPIDGITPTGNLSRMNSSTRPSLSAAKRWSMMSSPTSAARTDPGATEKAYSPQRHGGHRDEQEKPLYLRSVFSVPLW